MPLLADQIANDGHHRQHQHGSQEDSASVQLQKVQHRDASYQIHIGDYALARYTEALALFFSSRVSDSL